MNYFFDTSALVKYFHNEPGTESVTEIVLNPDCGVWVLELAKLEFTSALFRRVRSKELEEEELHFALSGIENELSRFNIEFLDHLVIEEALGLMKRFGQVNGLKTLDALHIASFTLLTAENCRMVSSDDVMNSIVSQMGYIAVNPIKN